VAITERGSGGRLDGKGGWNYRMFRRVLSLPDGTTEEEFYIGEAYYDRPGPDAEVTSWSAEPIWPRGSTKMELMDDLSLMTAAMNQPVVDLEGR
jgi:hypothetical protein